MGVEGGGGFILKRDRRKTQLLHAVMDYCNAVANVQLVLRVYTT